MLSINNRLSIIATFVIQYIVITCIWYLVVHLLETNPTITTSDRVLQAVFSLYTTVTTYQAFHLKDTDEPENQK